ncbi:methyltransferase family protein [Saccharicrinis sp. FJH54]|uniref:methyltransferase family protein n=1 Tax=Saccharicrinis sp. FJH54 TaxID=3344665 RepID=UPI0035D513FB
MSDYIKTGLTIIWLAVLFYWIISGLRYKRANSRESFIIRFFLYWLPLLLAFVLLGPGDWYGHSLLREKFVNHTNFVGITGLSLCSAGAIIACWSRYLIGKNWSLSVQKKENHELIQKGIYKFIRHPIYTGLLLLFTGNMLIVGDYRGIIAVLIVLISFLIKIKKEEKILTEIFGNQYSDYKSNTKALLPFLY